MYNLMYKNKGAISIFLLIVLVPMLIISSVFVDMSRINLAKSVAESSGVLTLNTALTNYDAVLKDMYGLFATSQDTDELFENLEEYYKQCIEAAGVSEPDADDYVAQIMQFIKSETGTDDMLNMNLTSFDVTKPTGGSLANPAVLKSQIVEFMKYRGPINLGSGIFEALGSLKNMKKQTTLVDNKNKFYDQQTNMMEKLESVWNDLEDYQYRDGYTLYDGYPATFPEGQYLQTYSDILNELVEPLKTSISYVVRYLYFANSYYSIQNSGAEGINIEHITSSEEAYTEIWKVTQGGTVTEYKIEAEPEERTVEELEEYVDIAFKAIQKLEEPNDVVDKLWQGNSVSTTEKIQMVTLYNSSLKSDYHNNIKNLVATLVELKNVRNGCKEDISKRYVIVNDDKTLTFTEEQKGPDLDKFIDDQLTKHLNLDGEHLSIYLKIVKRIDGFWNETKDVVINARTYVQNTTTTARYYAWAMDSFLEGKIKKLDSALGTLATIKTQLSDINSDYNKALSEWKKSANALSGESIGDNDLSEIAKLEKVLTIEKVNKLCTRLQGAKQSLESLKTQVEQFKVLDKAWKDLANNGPISYSTLQKLLSSSQKSNIENVTKSTNTGTEYIEDAEATYDKNYDTVINQLKATVTGVQLKTEWLGDEMAKSPDLKKNQVELYTWLYNNFFVESDVRNKFNTGKKLEIYTPTSDEDNNSSNKISSNKEDASTAQSGMEGKADEYNNSEKNPTPSSLVPPNRNYDTESLPSGEWKETVLKVLEGNSDTSKKSEDMLSSATNALSSLDGVMELVGDMATTLRDDLYICSYIMNMFSYSTYEAEIAVKNGNPGSAFASWYEWNNDENKYKLKSDFSTKYSNSSKMLKDARTLTKVSINPNANYLYGKEVEYIIYGDDGVAKSYGTIYMIRFALNTVYAFTDAEIGNITTAAATAIFGTPPLTPLIPIAKIAMTIGLALAESAYDLYMLKCGEEVPLIKNNSTWVMKPSSAADAIVGKALGEVADYAIDKGCQVLNNVLEMTDEQLEKYIRDNQDAIENLAQSSIDSTFGELKNYSNQTIQELMTICNNVNLLAMEQINVTKEEKIASATTQLQEWLEKQKSSDSDVVYAVKKAGVDLLVENGGKLIGDVFDALAKGGTAATELTQQQIENLGADLEEVLSSIQSSITTKVEELTGMAGNALSDLKTQTINELKEAAANGAESLKNKLREQIGSKFGSTQAAGTQSVMTSLLAWSYSDYLQLFLLIGIVASPESVLLRTADIIELNMQQIDENPRFVEVTTEKEVSRLWGLIKYTKTETKTVENSETFQLGNSYTYLNIKATIEVEPMMLTMPLMGDTVKSQLTGTNWYEITYEGTMGY